MIKMSNDEFLKILNVALLDKKLTNYEFRILVYIFNNDDFVMADLKKHLKISSFNMISTIFKNLVEYKYIIKENKHIKTARNISPYRYFINPEKIYLSENNTISKNSPFVVYWSLYYYFFEKIPTTRKIDKNLNFNQITLLIDLDKFELIYIKKLIDFVANDEVLKALYNRPLSFRKNIKQIITLFEQKK